MMEIIFAVAVLLAFAIALVGGVTWLVLKLISLWEER